MSILNRSIAALAVVAAMSPIAIAPAWALDRAKLTAHAAEALNKLEATEPRSRFYARHAKAVLVFPSILKAGFFFGGETGDGVLLVGGKPVGYYNLSGGSWGLQFGGQDFSYALFFMKDSALDYLKKSGGFAVGTGPSIVVVKKGAAAEADSTTVSQDVYAFPFNAKGLMANLSLEGTKITHIHDR
jgi:lipid-binding SYLF domain-containing protein